MTKANWFLHNAHYSNISTKFKLKCYFSNMVSIDDLSKWIYKQYHGFFLQSIEVIQLVLSCCHECWNTYMSYPSNVLTQYFKYFFNLPFPPFCFLLFPIHIKKRLSFKLCFHFSIKSQMTIIHLTLYIIIIFFFFFFLKI